MRVIAFSDIHLDAVTAGRPRRQEVVQFLERAREVSIQANADLVIFSGDAHDSGWLLDPLYTADLTKGLLSFPQELIAIAGNHDVVDTSELFDGEPVTTLTPLRAAAKFLPLDRGLRLHVIDRPQLVRGHSVSVGVLGLPYVSRAHSASRDAWTDEAFEHAGKYMGPVIVVAHLVVPGAVMGSESVEMAKGQDQLFPFERVALLGPSLVINGHYHARQSVPWHGVSVVIPGSPLRFTFGEAEEVSKGVTLVELAL